MSGIPADRKITEALGKQVNILKYYHFDKTVKLLTFLTKFGAGVYK